MACSDTNSKICTNDNTKCTVCKAANKYTNADTGFICADMPSSHGFKTKNPDVIQTCNAGVGCSDCVQDYQTCLGCSTSYFMKVDSNTCLTEAQIPVEYGHKSDNFHQIVPCADGLCLDCKANHGSCAECKTGNKIDGVTGACGVCDLNTQRWIDDKHCRSCHSSCKCLNQLKFIDFLLGKTCSGSLLTSCTECFTTGALLYLDSLTNECKACDQDGELRNEGGSEKRCERCHPSCKTKLINFKR